MESPKKETAQLSKRESKLALSLFPFVSQKPIFYERAVIFFLDPINPLPFRWYVLRLQRSRAAPQPRGSLIRLLLLLLLLQPPTDSFSFWFLLAPFFVRGGGSFVRLPHDNASLLPPPPSLFSVRFHHATGEKREEEEEEEDGTEPAMRSGENSTIRTRSKKKF